MKSKTISINQNDFYLTFENEGSKGYNMRWSGSVAEIMVFTDETWKFQSNQSSDFVEDIKDARIWFDWSFCWRGVWEGRIYFKDEEYWCEEIETIPLIWAQIEAIIKEKIKSDNPNYSAFDD